MRPASPPAVGDLGGTRQPLRVQFILALVGVVLVVTLGLAAVVPQIAFAYQLAALEQRLAAEARIIADYAATVRGGGAGAAPLVADPLLDSLAKRLGERSETRIAIIAPDGTVVGQSDRDLAPAGNQASRREVQQALAGGYGVDRRRGEPIGYEMLFVAVPIHDGDVTVGAARTALSLAAVDRAVGALTRALLLAAASAGLLALLVALAVADTIARPLARLTRLAAAVADDPTRTATARPAASLPTTGADAAVDRGHWLYTPPRWSAREVVLLAATLDRMARAVKASLDRLAAERDRLDAVLGNLADGVVMIDVSGRVTRLNAAAAQILGIPRQRARGRTVAEALRDHELVALVARARDTDALPRVVTAYLEWQQPPRFLRAAVTRFGQGADRQTLLVLQDLTELRRLETVRRDFVANVSHELRTPIAAVKAMVETLQDGAIDDAEAARDFVARIGDEVDGLHQLVEELLELSRLELGRAHLDRAAIDPAALARQAARRLAPLAERARVSLRAEVAEGLPVVEVDAERMGQLLVGIVHNAVKFTPPGGSIVVRAALDDAAVRLSVADSGIGLAPDDLPRIFERFYKASQRAPDRSDGSAAPGGGTGLGLAIAKHTVQLHGGAIWAESDGPGRGTTIHIRLPAAPPSTEAAGLPPPPGTAAEAAAPSDAI